MKRPLAEALLESDWRPTSLFVATGNLSQSPMRSDDYYEDVSDRAVEVLDRESYSHLGCLFLYRELKRGRPYGLKREKGDSVAQYLLHENGRFFSLSGPHSRAQAKHLQPDCNLAPVTWEELLREIKAAHMEEGEFRILERRFIHHIRENLAKWFPVP